jgi:hypothetical protein
MMSDGAYRAVQDVLELADAPMTARQVEMALDLRFEQNEISMCLSKLFLAERITRELVDRTSPTGRRKVYAYSLMKTPF